MKRILVPPLKKRPVRSWPGHEGTQRSKKRDNLAYNETHFKVRVQTRGDFHTWACWVDLLNRIYGFFWNFRWWGRLNQYCKNRVAHDTRVVIMKIAIPAIRSWSNSKKTLEFWLYTRHWFESPPSPPPIKLYVPTRVCSVVLQSNA